MAFSHLDIVITDGVLSDGHRYNRVRLYLLHIHFGVERGRECEQERALVNKGANENQQSATVTSVYVGVNMHDFWRV